MKIASVADVKARFSAYLKESEAGPIIITRNGKPTAVLLNVDDEDEIERLILAHSPKFRAILQAARQEIAETGGIPHDEFWRQVDVEYADAPVQPKIKAMKNGKSHRKTSEDKAFNA
jgi:prevent-host-death family protein